MVSMIMLTINLAGSESVNALATGIISTYSLHCWVSFSGFAEAYYDMLNGASGYKWNEKWSSGKHGMHSLHYIGINII